MTRSILPNFGFEYELAGRNVPRVVAQQSARFAHVLRLVPGFADAELHDDASRATATVAWGPSGEARSLAGQSATDWPDPSVVAWANDKRTSHAMELELDIALPGAAVVSSVDELRERVSSMERWVAKDPWGVAGRGQIRSLGDEERALDRATTWLRSGGVLVVEPLCDVRRNVSIHLDVDDDGVTVVGSTELLVHRSGTFRGNRTPAVVPERFLEVAELVGAKLHAGGWRGPVGIDGFIGTLDDAEHIRPLCEINARWSFGRLTIELYRELETALSWVHPARSEGSKTSVEAFKGAEPGIYTLPKQYDPDGETGTYLVLHSPGDSSQTQA